MLKLELTAVAGHPDTYTARMELRTPGAQATEVLTDGSSASFVLQPDVLVDSGTDESYTQQLSGAVFGVPACANALARARDAARLQNVPLRVRLALAANAAPLHRIRWELLGDPGRDFSRFATGQRTSLARWVQPRDAPSGPRRHRHGLRSVALVASPASLRDDAAETARPLPLARVPVAAFIDVATTALSDTRLRVLEGTRANLDALTRELEDGCDILVLTCHGALVNDRSHLYFEKGRREAQVVEGRTLAQRIGELREHPPRLAVLASCYSREDGLFFASLAYQLAMAGVPAVLAMQGPISDETARTFLSTFLAHVLHGNNVEAAVADARMRVGGRDDWWVPALLLGIDDGILWTAEQTAPEVFWNELVKQAGKGACTPIIGSDLLEPLSNRRLARYFSKHLRAPLMRGEPDLPRIAQQLKVEKGPERPGSELENFYRFEVVGRSMAPAVAEPVCDLLNRWARADFAEPACNPYRELAELRAFPVFVTTNPDDLLADALRAHELQPQVLVCPWKGRTEDAQALPRNVNASVERPAVFHLFGHLADPHSIVLTEDDFFDHLIWLSINSNLLPTDIVERFANSSLLFLGFRLEDWEFRILLRNIVKLPGSEMLSRFTHVAVQLDPSDLSPQEQADAEQALEGFFAKTEVRLEIYWGTVGDFLRGLRRHLRPERKPATVPS
jgi:hypothetical protein